MMQQLRIQLQTVPGTTTYTVTVSDAARPMCNVDADVTVTVVQPSVTISPNPAFICAGATSVDLTANALASQVGGTITSYSWSPAAGLSSTNTATTTASPAATTTYTLTVTDDNGCTATEDVTVTVGDPPGPTAVDGERCGTGSVSLAVLGCSGTTNWYDAAAAGNNVGNGNPFNTPVIASTTSYWATCTVSGCESARTEVIAHNKHRA